MSESEGSKQSKMVTEVVKWYLVNEKLTWLTGQEGNPLQGAASGGEADILNFAGHLSCEVGKLGDQCTTLLKTIDISDLVLLLGAGGVIAYLWRNSLSENTPESPESRLSARSFIRWLFDEETFEAEAASLMRSRTIYNLGRNSNIQEEELLSSSQGTNNLGLNVLSTHNIPRRFLKHRLFDISQLRDTTRFKERVKGDKSCFNGVRKQPKNHEIPEDDVRLEAVGSESQETSFSEQVSNFASEKCKFSKSKYLPTAQLYGNAARGTPDGQERCSPSPAPEQANPSDEKLHLNRAAVDPKAFPISGSMMEIMQNAKEVRRLIREASLDSQASDFCFDSPLIETHSGTEETFQICQYMEEREESLPPLNVHLIDSKGLWKLVGFNNLADRESSILSDYSDNWRDVKPYKVALGHSSTVSEVGDDFGSNVGSCLDPWEWDDECYYEGDFKSQNFEEDSSEQQLPHTAWLPDTGEELDLEAELRLRNSSIYSSAYSSKDSSVTRDFKLIRRLPPSGRSSVESLNKSPSNSLDIKDEAVDNKTEV
eukprot:GFUD01007847.1.p1 GENE.GFUD01007847.1~~GFUD01007847.1.p1  ORF type:complete len:568 (+),score=124.23 GFUD01007847.1:84-1706(+)